MGSNTIGDKYFPIIHTGEYGFSRDGKTELKICGYSLGKYPKECDYIYDHCKEWGFFGDGLCFSCHHEDDNCPFKNIKL